MQGEERKQLRPKKILADVSELKAVASDSETGEAESSSLAALDEGEGKDEFPIVPVLESGNRDEPSRTDPGTPALHLVDLDKVRKQSAAVTDNSLNRAEVLLQYGNLQNEIVKFNRTLMLHKKTGTDVSLLAMVAILSPFLFSEWTFALLKLTHPTALVQFGRWLCEVTRTNMTTFSDYDVMNLVRVVWDGFGGGLVFVLLLGYIIVQSARATQTGIFSPTHMGIGLQGIRMYWNFPFWTFAGRLWRWESIRGLTLRKRKTKSGQLFKSLELRDLRGRKRKFDLRRFRREQDRELIARAFKNFLPQAQEAFEVREVMLLDDCDPSYTKLWTQSLLTPPNRERLASLEPGAELSEGRFIVERRIGGGGQGTAYLAEAHIDEAFTETVKQVVLKEYVLPDPKNMFDRRRALKKLEHEVALLGRLSNQGIARFIDVFVEDHRAYLVTEYVDGDSLRGLVAERGPFTRNEAVELAIEMCDILTYLHGLEPPVVHQDFTPENILRSSAGIVKLVDFNVAKETITIKTGLVVGKQAYMPPEQFKGKACPASDVYALGGTLYFLLTGVDPEPLTASRPSRKDPSIEPALDEIVYRSTALDLETRYKTAADMKADLLQLCEMAEAPAKDVSADGVKETVA